MMDSNCKSPLPTAARKFARLHDVVRALGALCICAGFLSSCQTATKKTPSPIAVSAPSGPTTVGFKASLSSARVVDGSLVVVDVHLDSPKPAHAGEVTAQFEEKKFSLYPVNAVPGAMATHFQGLLGIPHSHAPGAATLKITTEGAEPLEIGFQIDDAHYPSETLKVDNRKVNPRKSDMVRIKRELAEVNEVYKTESEDRFWNGAFLHPIDSAITDQYGMKRLYNGQLRNYHGGMDFKAAIGTPIHASAAGRVVLAKELFYSGGTVVIDHGFGLLTMYFHMSRIDVKKGELLKEGQLLGLSGKTGRVTGPHLHFQVVVHQVKVNPRDLFEELR